MSSPIVAISSMVASLGVARPDRRLGTLVPGAEAIHRIKLNGVEPYACLRDALARIADGHPAAQLDALLPFRAQPGAG